MPSSTAVAMPAGRGRAVSLAAGVCSALGLLVLAGFFVIGLVDGSVSSFNIALWLALLGVATASLWGGLRLRAAQRHLAATAVLAVTAVPAVLAAAFVLLLLVTQPRWN